MLLYSPLCHYLKVSSALVALCYFFLNGFSAFCEPLSRQNNYEKANDRGIWDGRWTEAASGKYWEIPDKGHSDTKAGTKPATPHYLIPTFQSLNLHYTQVEAAELAWVQSPMEDKTYAVLTCSQALQDVGGRKLPVGVYGVALRWMDPELGAPAEHESVSDFPKSAQPYLVVKQQGKLLAVFPVVASSPYFPNKKQAKAKPAVASLSSNDTGPVIELYVGHTQYLAAAQPAQLPILYPATDGTAPYTQLEPKPLPKTNSDPKFWGY